MLCKRNEFTDEEELGFYLFGNRYTRNRVYWEVDSLIREDCGIKTFDPQLQNVDLEKVSNFLIRDSGGRQELIEAIGKAIDKGKLTTQERCVVSLLYDLCYAEDHREDQDNSAWTTKEIADAMEISEKDVIAIKKQALAKIRPLLNGYS